MLSYAADSEMQVVVVCGKNEPLQRALSAEIARAEGCNAARGPLGIKVTYADVY
jgi:hypothetical protein